MILVFAFLACQEPFPEGRDDLYSFRIAAVSASASQLDGQTILTASALIAGAGGLSHRSPPALSWEMCGQAAEGAAPVATFAEAPWPCEVRLIAQSADEPGLEEEAVLALGEAPEIPVVAGVVRVATDMVMEDAVLSAEERAARTTGEDAPIEAGGAVAVDLALDPAADPEGSETRWMSTGGTLRPRDRHAADWFAGDIEIDDGEIEAAEAISGGIYSVVALTMDGAGGNGWRIVDVAVGEAEGGAAGGAALSYRDRLLPVDVAPTEAPGEAPYLATFTALDSEEAGGGPGYTLSDLEAAVDLVAAPPICGQPAGTAFDPGWLASGACGTAELDGQRLLIAGAVWP